jgi:sugar phosphate isomerase/epimerase
MSDPAWILWAGTVDLEGPLDQRIAAAVAAGYDAVSISPLDVERAESSGTTARELGRWIRGEGLEVVMDPVLNWYGGKVAAGSRFGRFPVQESLRMCADLGVRSLSALAQRSGHVPLEAMTQPFGDLCDAASDFGASVHLEFIPMTQIPDLRSAWTIVESADRPNGGLLLDTWHFFRGDPDLDLLATLPGDRVLAVQVDDANEAVVGDLWQDTRQRRLPGDGSFDLMGVLRVLDQIGGLSLVGPEVISTETAAMDPSVAAKVAGDRVRVLVEEVRGQ